MHPPANPTWDVIDIAAAAELARQSGALLAVDSTCAPPVTSRPLTFGAGIVFHSATKYLNGHSDVTAGLLTTGIADVRWSEIKSIRVSLGSILPPFETWLLMRGLRTLHLRFAQASANAMIVARHFENHSRIERVLYPGLESHPGHQIATRQMMDGYGGMLSLLIKGGEAEAKRVASSLRTVIPATSLGGVESLAEHRKSVEGPNSIVPANLIRLSVGIEAVEDVIDDLERALAAY